MASTAELLVLLSVRDMASKQIESFGKSLGGFGALGKVAAAGMATVAAAGAALTAGLVGAVGQAADFESAMSAVAAVAGGSDADLKRLSDTALALGMDTTLAGVGATDAARAMRELAAAGLSVDDIIGGAALGALRLASAGGVDVARAAEIAAMALANFGLAGSDAARLADLFAAAANSSAISVDDIAEAMKYVGPIANSMGLSIDEVTATIAALGNQGIKSSQAGTSLRSMLVSLAKPSEKAADLIRDLGLQFFDAGGHMKSIAGISEELKTKLSGLTDQQRAAALAQLFGNEALTAATVLYGEGADGIAKWLDEVQNGASAAQVGAMRNDNLKGSIEALKSAFETAQIALGTAFLPALRALVDVAADAVAASIPLIQAWGPRFAAALQSGVGRAAAIVQAFGAAVAATFRALQTGDFSRLFGPLVTAIATAFGSDVAGKVTLFVSGLVTNLNRARDAVLTARQAFAGDWVSADSIATPVRLIGQAFTALGDAVRTIQGFLARLPDPVKQVAAAFAALGPALRVAAVAAPLLLGAFTGLGPILRVLTSSIPLLGSVIAALGGPLTLIVAGVALLAAAWISDWGGIRAATMPVIQQIVGFVRGTLLPGLSQLGTFLTTTVVPAFLAGWAQIQSGVSTAIAAILPLVQQFSAWFSTNLLPALQNLAAVAVPALQQMGAAVVSAFGAAQPGLTAFIGGVQQLGAAVLPILQSVATTIMASLGPAVMAVLDWAQTVIPQFAKAWESVWSVVGPIVGEIASFIGATLGAIAGFISAHSDQITGMLKNAWAIIEGTIAVAFSLITGIISAALQLISGDWEGAWNTIKQTAQNVWDGITKIVTNGIDLIKSWLTVGMDGIKSLLAAGWESVKQTASNAWDDILGRARTGWDNVMQAIETALENALAAVVAKIGDMVAEMAALPGKALDAVGDLSGVLVGAGRSLIQGLIDGIEAKIADAIAIVRRGIQQIADLLPGSEPKDQSSPLRGLSRRGAALVDNFAAGIAAQAGQLDRALRDQLGAVAPGGVGLAPGGVGWRGGGGAGGGGVTNQYNFRFDGDIYGLQDLQDKLIKELEDAQRRGRI